MQIYEFFEILMLVCFGASWPINAYKSYKCRTAKAKSIVFLSLILIGYLFGIAGKLISGSFHWYVLFFYVLNFCFVFADFLLYFRNRKLDREREQRA